MFSQNLGEPASGRINTPQLDHWTSFGSFQSLRSFASFDSDYDPLVDVKLAKCRGFISLAATGCCVLLFLLGLYFPLIEVVLFPDGILEKRVVISLMRMLALCLGTGFYIGFLVMFICVVCIPLILFVGILVIVWDNFFATGFGWNKCLSPEVHAFITGLMYVSTSYQALMVFLPVELMCFFSGFGQTTHLRAGFYFLSLYCFISIALCQAVEGFRVPDPAERDAGDGDLSPSSTIPSMTGFHLRRKFSSLFPSLPGIKETVAVDAFQVIFFFILFIVLLVLGFDQPLLDIRVMLEGVALERMVLSLKDMLLKLYTSDVPFVVAVFTMLVIVVPLLYGTILFAAGIIDIFLQCCCLTPKQRRRCLRRLLLMADLLRPWVMIDVFSIALVVVLYAMQNDYVVATIPDGIVQFSHTEIFHTGWHLPRLSFGSRAKEAAGNREGSKAQVFWLQFFSGIYLIVGSSVAVIFLRWFWSTNQGMRRVADKKGNELRSNSNLDQGYENFHHKLRSDTMDTEPDFHSSDEEQPELIWSRTLLGKACRCLLIWTLICFIMHGVTRSLPKFELMHMNTVIQKTMPKVNKLMKKYLPHSYGSCTYPPGKVPLPCFEDGYLDKELESDKRITALWMSGLNTMKFTDVSINRTQEKDQPLGWNFGSSAKKMLNHYTLSVSGVIEQPRLFLRIEQCELNTTSMMPIVGKGTCKPFYETDRSCCDPNRGFHVQMAASCHFGDDSLQNVRVQSIHVDNMEVIPTMEKGQIVVKLADKNITETVMKRVKENLRFYLIEQKLFRSGGVDLTFAQLLNRVLRFNAPDQEFHCR